jgi:hypothetical protein
MTIHRTAVVHTSIQAPPEDVVAVLSNLEHWKTWGPWIRSVARSSPRDWTLETDAGVMKVHFVEPNSFGVLNHEVRLESGITVTNGMRVMPNGTGSELVMVLFQLPQVSTQEFERDIQAVTGDLARLKQAVEAVLPSSIDGA